MLEAHWHLVSVCGRPTAFGFDIPYSRGSENVRKRGRPCPRCRTVRLPTVGIALLAGNAAERISCVSSRFASFACKRATSRQRPSPTTSRRIEGTTTHSGSVRSAAYAPTAITGSTGTMPRARRCARMARPAIRTTHGCFCPSWLTGAPERCDLRLASDVGDQFRLFQKSRPGVADAFRSTSQRVR